MRELSAATGGYARARSRLPLTMVNAVADGINAAITGTHKEIRQKGHKLFALDGASIRLEHTADKLEATHSAAPRKRRSIILWLK